MRKSPFSTPRGNGHSNNGWRSGDNSARGYGRVENSEFWSPSRHGGQNSSLQSLGDDFIPFGGSMGDRSTGGRWSSPTNWQSPGRGNNRNATSPAAFNNYYRNNGPRANHRQSPYYKNGANSHRRNNRKSDVAGGKLDLSGYVNLKWFLEDPWAELMGKLERSSIPVENAEEAAHDRGFDGRI